MTGKTLTIDGSRGSKGGGWDARNDSEDSDEVYSDRQDSDDSDSDNRASLQQTMVPQRHGPFSYDTDEFLCIVLMDGSFSRNPITFDEFHFDEFLFFPFHEFHFT